MEKKMNPPFTIDYIREKTVPIAKKYGISRMSLFGSYARGEADKESDVDILIDCGNGKIKSLLPYFAFVYDLEDEFNCHVDVVSKGSSNKKFLEAISKEEVLLYSRN